MKKRTKVFLSTIVILSVFTVGTAFGSTVILKFTGADTIEEAKNIIESLKDKNNSLIDEYNKLDTKAHDINNNSIDKDKEIQKWKDDRDRAYQEKWQLEQEKNKEIEQAKSESDRLKEELLKANNKCNELQEVINNTKVKEFNKSDLVN